ncbi:MAG: hypothetical protein ABW051_04935 [Burkholderiaceae bacterium]
MSRYIIAAACLAAATFAGPAGAQQRYYCEGARGQVITSTTPCPAGGGIGGAAAVMPADSPGPYTSQQPRREEHVQYMSGRCQDLVQAMRRTEPTISPSAAYQRVREARQRYDELCSEEELEARRRVRDQGRQARSAKSESEQRERNESAARAQDESRTREQCIESKRILMTRKARTDLNEGEKKDLARFEDNVRQRCPLGN